MAAVVPFIPYIVMTAGTIFSAVSQRKAGKDAEAAAQRQAEATQRSADRQAAAMELNAKRQAEATEFEAEQLDQIAGQETAAAQHRAQEERRRSGLLQSRVRAIAGAGASDQTVVDIISDLAGEGEYLAAVQIFGGEEAARRARMGATGARFEGGTALEAGRVGAAGLRAGSGEAAANLLAGGAAARSRSRYDVGATIFQGAGMGLGMYGKYGTTWPNTKTALTS